LTLDETKRFILSSLCSFQRTDVQEQSHQNKFLLLASGFLLLEFKKPLKKQITRAIFLPLASGFLPLEIEVFQN